MSGRSDDRRAHLETPRCYRFRCRLPLVHIDRRDTTTVDDRTRLDLHRKLDEILGPDEADTLMAHLPPVTWSDVATKDDLRALEAVLSARIDGSIARAMERQIRWMVTFNTGLVALAFAGARLVF